MELKAADFGIDFAWGVSTAAYQIEGAHLKHGKGLSIWDEFTQRKGKIYKCQHANISCDFYQNYYQDLALMRSMNISNFRFSIAWARLFPEGTGAVNRSGVDFYNGVIDFCLELEIVPWITLYHWDLPLALDKKGGWTNRDIVGWFSEYAAFCIKAFGDRVRNWLVLNEPMVFTGAGYFLGIHAPGKKGLSCFLQSAHHAALCQAEGARVMRSLRSDLNIGTTFSFSHIEPFSSNDNDRLAAVRIDALLNRMFIEPLLGKGYPFRELKVLERIEEYINDGDEAKLSFDMDFIGVQVYTREIVSHSFLSPFLQARVVKADERNMPRTQMNWEVYPQCIYHILKKVAAYNNVHSIIITENGAAFPDEWENGCINDEHRRSYLHDHIQQVLIAKKDGVPVNGYFIWSFTDNFEWCEGYHPKFGLVSVDFSSQKRTVKLSGFWYSNFLRSVKSGKLQELGINSTRQILNLP